MSKFEIFKGKDDKYRYRLKSNNGEIVLASPAFTSKTEVVEIINKLKRVSKTDNIYVRKTGTKGGYYFVVKLQSGQTIGMSEQYVSKSGREIGVQVVKKISSIASLE